MKTVYTIMITSLFILISSSWSIAQTQLINSGAKLKVQTASFLVVQGDIINTAPADSAIFISGTLNLSGKWTNNSTNGNLQSGSQGKIILSGSNLQHISGTQTSYFNDMEIQNASGVILDIPIFIEGNLIFNNGIIYCSSGKELNMTDGSTYTGASDASHIEGPVKKTGSTDFVFPVGDKGYIQQIAILDLASNQTFTAEYIRGLPPQNTNYAGNLTRVSSVEYWHLTPASGNPQINMALYWNNGDSSGITNPQTLLIAHQKANGQWEDIPYISGNGAATAGSIKGGPVSTYSLYTLGTTNNIDNPLPIELLSFDAKVGKGFSVDLTWITASELNNDFFTVEHSQYGTNWEEVGIIKGAGNSNTILRYALTDFKPYMGVSYYRLKQTDFNGSFSYSDIKTVNFDALASGIVVYPNPTSNFIFVKNIPSQKKYMLTNMIGEILDQGIFEKDSKLNLESLASGVYNLHLYDSNTSENNHQVFKVIKN